MCFCCLALLESKCSYIKEEFAALFSRHFWFENFTKLKVHRSVKIPTSSRCAVSPISSLFFMTLNVLFMVLKVELRD